MHQLCAKSAGLCIFKGKGKKEIVEKLPLPKTSIEILKPFKTQLLFPLLEAKIALPFLSI
jgi:hypothetical protein